MSSIGNVNSATALIQPKAAVGKKEMEKEDFLTLFITQLQYQDPMKPMDSYEMASQLAQFSNMEATMNMSNNMEKLLDYQLSQNNLQLLGLLGTEVQVSGNQMGLLNGEATATEFTLFDEAPSTLIEIYDGANKLVWQEDRGYHGPGTYVLDWDGKDLRGNTLTDGAYSYVVKAKNAVGGIVDVDYRSTGKVTGINFDTGAALLTMDGFVTGGVDAVVSVNTPNVRAAASNAGSDTGSEVEPEVESEIEAEVESEFETETGSETAEAEGEAGTDTGEEDSL